MMASALFFTLVWSAASAPVPEVAGVVVDAAGTPVPGAFVVARDSAKGMTHLTVADGAGAFRLRVPIDAGVALRATSADGNMIGTMPVGAGNPHRVVVSRTATPARRPSSAAWLALLPDTEMRRRFVLDCTGCHQFDETRALKDGAPRDATQWTADIQRMLGYAGPRSNFPVISTWAEDPSRGGWLAGAMGGRRPGADAPGLAAPSGALITEYDFPNPQDLPHDLAVDARGRVIVTGMFSHALFELDPATGQFERTAIPVDRANPRAIEIDREGHWWVLLGGPAKIGRYTPGNRSWQFFDIGMYPHSIAVASPDEAWFNGHFSRDPEQVGRVRASSGEVKVFDLPGHPTLRTEPGGPVPYEQRIGPDGRIWVSELQGNRLIAFDPKTGGSEVFTLPATWSGPRRFDIGADGIVWIPAYAANQLVRLDPATGRFTEFPMPMAGATPYIARVERGSGAVWIGTSAADAVFRFDPATGRFARYPLPSQGALIRHLAIDETRGEVWVAYGASPGRLPARVARIRPR